MSDYVFDGDGSVPNGKVDANPLGVSANKGITAPEWNTVMQNLKDLRAAILTGLWHGLSQSASAVSALGKAAIRFNADKSVQISEDAGMWRRVMPANSLHVYDFGAKGDGTTDDATAIQTAINAAIAQKKRLYFDPLTYKINTELTTAAGHGLEVVALGTANSQHTIIKAEASIRSVLCCATSYLKIEGIQFDANRSASYGVILTDSSFDQFSDCQMLNAKLDGIHLSVSGINDNNLFENCWSYANGKVWCTTGFNFLFTNYTKGAATGTIATTSGDEHIVGTGTNFTAMGIRSGDFLRIDNGGGQNDLFLQISTVVDDTHLTVGTHKTPTATISGKDFAISVGNGYVEERHNDNNISRIVGGLWRLNAGSGMSFNGLFGPKIDHPQLDLNGFYGACLGTTDQEVVYATHIDHPYFEGNFAAPILFGCSIGSSVTQPQYGVGTTPLYHIGTTNQNIGTWEDYDGIKPIGNAVCTMPVTTSDLTGFLVNGPLMSRGEAQSVASNSYQITSAPHLVLLSLSADRTLTSTPTLTAGSQDGHEVVLYNQTGNNLTLQDESQLTGSKLKLNSLTRVLALGQSIRLMYLGGFWREITVKNADASNPGFLSASDFTKLGNQSNTNSGDVTLAAVGSTPSANGASLSGQALTLQPADGSHPGLLSASNFTKLGNQSGTNSGDVTLAAVGSSPSANGASLSGQALTLQPGDQTHPGLLSIIAQSIAGLKTYFDGLAFHNPSGGSAWTFLSSGNDLQVTVAADPYVTFGWTTGVVRFKYGIGVGNSAAATTIPVSGLVKKIEVFDAAGTSLGFVPVYSSIT